MKFSTLTNILSAAALSALLLSQSTSVQADSWTGCVNPGGQIKNLRQGDTPLRPCHKNEVVIHLSDLASKQSTNYCDGGTCDKIVPGATYDHQLICDAFVSVNVGSTILEALGCPSGSEAKPSGPVIRVDPTLGLIDPLIVDICRNDPGSTCVLVEQAFIGNQFQVPNLGTSNVIDDGNFANDSPCPNACESDGRCFLAWLENALDAPKTSPSLTCHLYYRSEFTDTEHYCADIGSGTFTPKSLCNVQLQNYNLYWKRVEVEE